METIIRIFENIRWCIFNHPPTSITAATGYKCDYCGNDSGWTHYEKEGFTLCHKCIKKIADIVLVKTKEEHNAS